ncbi:amino acid permease [Fimicolochytrium jonesii]|uniref:amino acid permease n=1 Tax=Fimicolochytrium jonesii TaxID=1396493 RepID=UPI0022FDD5E6|nr:amino acid permease [Fimicolochytrium jonesii]KAI8816718.1 amino acid permease [Fimicolochytrium jonesii]
MAFGKGKNDSVATMEEVHGHPDYAGEPVNTGHELHRALKNRHIAMISIGGVIGTGLFLGTGTALHNGGPAGLLLGYAIMGTICFAVMTCIGEMVAFLPVAGGHITLARRFVDPAFSFALGWNYWYNWVITLPTELTAAALIINFWGWDVNSGVWITICLLLVVAINLLGTRAYGEAEFWFASIKVLTIVCLIIVGIVIAAGGGPNGNASGFTYWNDPGAFNDNFNGITGSLGKFLGFWAVLIQAAFSYIGTEIVAIAAGEAENPRRNIPKAIKRVSFRIVTFYILGTFVIGLTVAYNDPTLIAAKDGTANGSPFVIAIKNAGIGVLPSIINFCVLTSAWSAASSDLYTSSRALYGLAVSGQAPKIFTRTSKNGLPYYAAAVSILFTSLAYLSLSKGAGKVFGWLQDLTAICGLITWTCICIIYLRFHAGMKAQNIDRNRLPYKSPFGVWGAYYALVWIIIVMLTNAWQVFRPGHFDLEIFITSYLPLPLFFVLFAGAKIFNRTKFIAAQDMDFVTGVRDFEESHDTTKKPRTRGQRVWNWLM